MRSSSRMTWLVRGVLVVACFCGASVLRAEQPLIEESWYLLRLAGQDLGTEHDISRQMAPADAGQPALIQTVVTLRIAMKRLGAKIEVQLRMESLEEPSGAVRSFRHSTLALTGSTRIEGSVEGQKLHLTRETPGRVERQELPWDPQVLGVYGQSLRLREKKLAQGDVIQFKVFVPELQRVGNVTVTAGLLEKVDVAGKPMELRKTVTTNDAMPGLPTDDWLDEEGVVQKSYVPALGGLERVLVDAETAKKSGGGAEVMRSFLIPANCRIPKSTSVTSALYKLTAPAEALEQMSWTSPRQVVVKQEKGSVILRVTRERPGAGPAGAEGQAAPLSEKDLAPYLASTAYLQSDDDAIRKVAAPAKGSPDLPLPGARRLERWVYDNIKKKDLAMAFSTASEVMKTRQGDCTEHAVLLAALCRAAGIPSRVTHGVVYAEGFFGYHLWAEVYDKGWVALDATRPQEYVDATHIAFGSSALDMPAFAAESLLLAQLMGVLKIEVLEYTTEDGKVTLVGQPTGGAN